MYEKIRELKEELKGLAVQIRKGKRECKEHQKTHGGSSDFEWRTEADIYRYKHIAYCLLRGRTMQQIENKNRKGNEPKPYWINKYMELYREQEETIHTDKI
jgi:hypothetical protein